jgi:Raf kinase inhibitor-like YbhB/YbcL family protein
MKPAIYVSVICSILAFLCSCSSKPSPNSNEIKPSDKTVEPKTEIRLISTAFNDGEMIPGKYTCDGANVSPPLSWSGVPANAKALALICDDPDAPGKTWVHWVVYDLPAGTGSLPENVSNEANIATGGKQGTSDFRKVGYDGPCPPSGAHRYYFKIYALDGPTPLNPGATKDQLLKAIEGHVVAQGQLLGKYQRQLDHR